jgi:hypothetical protein
MTTEIVLLALVFIWQAIEHQVAARRSSVREAKLLQVIAKLENRIHAKDLHGYMELRESDKKLEAPLTAQPAEVQEDPGRLFSGSGVY